MIMVLPLLTVRCSKMPVYQSNWEKGKGLNLTEFTGYDSDSKIRYLVSNDDTHLYLSFDTESRAVLMNILRSGAKIYVDTNARKKGTSHLTYPYIKRPGDGARATRGSRPGQGDRQSMQQALNQRIMGLKEGLWVWGDSESFIDLQLDNSEFDGVMRIDTAGRLQYFVAIPFHSIQTRTIDELAIGIEVEAPSMPSQGMYGGNRGEMGIGGRPPGTGGGGGYGRPDSQRPDQSTFDSDPVKIWFKVKMAKE